MNSNLQTLRKIKLYGMAAHLEAYLAMSPHQRPDQDLLLAQLIQAEDLYRSHRKTTLSIKNARFRYQASIQQIICSTDRNLSKQQLNYYLDGSFIDRAENIIITGATGCGKSYLASAIDHHVCTLGKKVAYHSLPKLLQKLKSDRIDGSFRKELEKIENRFGNLQAVVSPVSIFPTYDEYGNKSLILVCFDFQKRKWLIVNTPIQWAHESGMMYKNTKIFSRA